MALNYKGRTWAYMDRNVAVHVTRSFCENLFARHGVQLYLAPHSPHFSSNSNHAMFEVQLHVLRKSWLLCGVRGVFRLYIACIIFNLRKVKNGRTFLRKVCFEANFVSFTHTLRRLHCICAVGIIKLHSSRYDDQSITLLFASKVTIQANKY